jgi:hypothetical protein
MSASIYNKAFAMELTHDFYGTVNKFKVNSEFEIVPTIATAKLLQNGRMRYRRTDSGFTVFYKAYLDAITDTEVPLVKLDNDSEFIFAMRMKQDSMPFMLNTTNLDQGGTYSSGKIFLLDATAGAVTPASIVFADSLVDQLRPSVFTYTFLPNPATVANLTVKVFPEGSVTAVLTIPNVPIDPATGIYSVGIDLSEEPDGIYTIEATDGATLHHSATLYIDTELAKENVFGLMRIKYPVADRLYDSCTNKNDYFTYSYAFENREVPWRYYIAIKDPGAYFTPPASFLQIVDLGPTTYTFLPEVGPGRPSTGFSLVGYNTVVVFTSSAAIPFTETAIKSFQLQEDDATPVLSALSNAAYEGVDSNRLDPSDLPNACAEIFMFVETLP